MFHHMDADAILAPEFTWRVFVNRLTGLLGREHSLYRRLVEQHHKDAREAFVIEDEDAAIAALEAQERGMR